MAKPLYIFAAVKGFTGEPVRKLWRGRMAGPAFPAQVVAKSTAQARQMIWRLYGIDTIRENVGIVMIRQAEPSDYWINLGLAI